MNKLVIPIIIASLVATGVIISQAKNNQPTDEECCTTCEGNKVKYYSVVTDNNRCGECCLNPMVFWIFKLFEKNLTLSENGVTCETFGYRNYENTQTHGVFPIKVTLDMYTNE